MSATSSPDRIDHGHRRIRVLAVLATASFVAAGCAPPSPPADGGGVEIDLGPLTVPLPPIEVRAPGTTIPLGLCSAGYRPPGVEVVGATLTIPKVRIDPNRPILTVPDVQVRIPQLRVPTSTVTLRCGLIVLPTQIDLIIPSSVHIRAATLNLDARTITLADPSFTIEGAGLGVLGLGDLILPLPPIVSVPLPTSAIAF